MKFLAHIDMAQDGSFREESIESHLSLTCKLAGRFAAPFRAEALAQLLARNHDLGKFSVEFQDYLRKSSGDSEETDECGNRRHGPDHSSAGAQELAQTPSGIGLLLSYAAAGHHAGLPDGLNDTESCLKARLNKNIPEWRGNAQAVLNKNNALLDFNQIASEIRPFLVDGYSTGFLVRMLFSCLVDADFIATEQFMSQTRAAQRIQPSAVSIETLQHRLSDYYEILTKKTRDNGTANSSVNSIRNEVKEDCLRASEKAPGLFTLTVPTGGGKTLASMAFALKHACKYGLARIIYVIPYTSIIEQNAKVFRNVFGDDVVLEHHCAVTQNDNSRAKLLSENWDAPIVVTTSVQFFESLHAHKTSRCRKLHNLANAVVILDEAQTLPVDLLKPCLRALDELVMRYKTSVVLCTATQPAVLATQMANGGLTGGTQGCREIIAPNRNLAARLKRVKTERIPGKLTDDELLSHLADCNIFLVIVSTRSHARELFLKTQTRFYDVLDSVFHLSAQMCPEHRNKKLAEIKRRLAEGRPCRVVTTQLIEAGVDIDFPCVFREIAGLDSCAQAAGRCNREGRMPENGRVCLFESADFNPPSGFLRTAAQIGRMVLDCPSVTNDLLAPEAVTKFFELLYSDQRQALDKFRVLSNDIPRAVPRAQDDFFTFLFRTLGEKFHFIENSSVTVFVPYGEQGVKLCEDLRKAYAPREQRELARKLQRYAVSVYGQEPRDGNENLIAENVHNAFWILTSTKMHYSDDFGIIMNGLEGQMLDI